MGIDHQPTAFTITPHALLLPFTLLPCYLELPGDDGTVIALPGMARNGSQLPGSKAGATLLLKTFPPSLHQPLELLGMVMGEALAKTMVKWVRIC